MKKYLVSMLLIFFVAGNLCQAGVGEKYGKKFTLSDTTKISTILATPEKFVGKKLLVKGLVLDVCKMRGCWINVASDKEFQKLRVKVKDGEIVFPMTAKGKTALVEGELQKFELTKEQVIKMKKHQAEENGEDFDPATVKGGETYYQLKGLGAIITK